MVRDPPAPNNRGDMTFQGSGLRRRGPVFVVGAPRRSSGYAVVAPRPALRAGAPRGGGARNAVHPRSSATC